MFTDESSKNYKLNCRYDFYFDGNLPAEAQLGYRIASRKANQSSIVSEPYERTLVFQDASEVRIE
jgi:hypothetical protein